MGWVKVVGYVPALDADVVYKRIAAFEDYPDYSDAVRVVSVLESTADTITSSWEVNFRRGILCWVERAHLMPERGLIEFSEVEGDVEEFTGHWRVEAAEGGTEVEFSVRFEVGIPTLEHILDPIAEEALAENIASILSGLLGEGFEIRSTVASGQEWTS